MSTAWEKTILTFIKFLWWTGVAAGIEAAINNLAHVNLPGWTVPLLGAALKAGATYAASRAKEFGP